MSRHVWLTKQMAKKTVEKGFLAWQQSYEGDLPHQECLRFVGYFLEANRQKGGLDPAKLFASSQPLRRYTKGANKKNYLKVGKVWWAAGGRGLAGAHIKTTMGMDPMVTDETLFANI